MHPTFSFDRFLLLLIGLILGGQFVTTSQRKIPSTSTPKTGNIHPTSHNRLSVPRNLCHNPCLSSEKIDRDLENKAAQMIQKKRYTPMKKLLSQMTRKRYRVPLQKTPITPTPDIASLYRKRLPSMLILGSVFQCDDCTKWHVSGASGFVLTAQGIAVTNRHVVLDPHAETLFAATAEGGFYPVTEILATDEASDIAIVRLDAKGLTPLSLAQKAPVGTPVRVISNPDSHYFYLSEGIVSGYYDSPTETPEETPTLRMTITADYAKGSSGAPILDQHGHVIGMVKSTDSVYYHEHHGHQKDLQMVFRQCVPVDQIRALIQAP